MTAQRTPGAAGPLPPPIADRSGVALCLSGGGYRAALFHLGALRRLDELGVLPKITTISSVSGGSIVSAFLATRLAPWPTKGNSPQFEEFAHDLRALTKHNIRVIPSYHWLERAYRKGIGGLNLGDLQAGGPSFVFCATDMANGVNWTFGKDLQDAIEPGRWEAGSYRAGFAPASELPLARAVVASSSFPPVLGPVRVPIEPGAYEFKPPKYHPHATQGIIDHLRLTDGGVYDNLGLEPVWKTHKTILVSDGGSTLDQAPYSPFKPWKRFGRYMTLANSQGGTVRRRWLMSNYKDKRKDDRHYEGAYFGIGSNTSGDRQRSSDTYPEALIDEHISEMRTDLDAFSDEEAGILQNQGYLICDAAVRSWAPALADKDAQVPLAPFPDLMDVTSVAAALSRRKSNKRHLPFGRFH